LSQGLNLVMVGDFSWMASLPVPDGFVMRRYTGTDRFVARLTDDLAAMVIVDGADPSWPKWTAAPKSSAATRRIPVVVVTDDESVRQGALTHGANFVISTEDIHTTLATLIAKHARVPDPAREEQLDCECAETLPPLALEGVEKFNNREFYPQHDLFEEQWMATDGPVRDLYRAVLQVGVAYYQVERGNYRGARKMLLRAVQWLETLPDVCQTIDVAQLRDDAYAVRAELERIPPDAIDSFDTSLLKPLRIVT
jgi:predicted metal-dependent hydrolase